MGLFDFVKEAGAKVFNFGKDEEEAPAVEAEPEVNHAREAFLKEQAEMRNAEMAVKLAELVGGMGFDMENVWIEVNDSQAILTGSVPTQAELEKIVLLCGNTEGISSVDSQLEVVTPEPEATFYTVAKGDNLSKIAKEHYGASNKYPMIFEANKPMLSDPDKIYPGQVLRIPPLDEANV